MIVARYTNLEVQVIDSFTTGDGRRIAVVKALRGKPFTDYSFNGGPSDSDTAQVPAALLKDVRIEREQDNGQPNLLELALAEAKPQWCNGESVWLVRNGNGSGAFLKNSGNGFVTLNVVGCRDYLKVFYLDPESWTWVIARDLEKHYQAWASKAQEALK